MIEWRQNTAVVRVSDWHPYNSSNIFTLLSFTELITLQEENSLVLYRRLMIENKIKKGGNALLSFPALFDINVELPKSVSAFIFSRIRIFRTDK
jgi:hypothetical protein